MATRRATEAPTMADSPLSLSEELDNIVENLPGGSVSNPKSNEIDTQPTDQGDKTNPDNPTTDITIEEITDIPPEPEPEPEEPITTKLRKAAEEGILSVIYGGQSYKIGSRRLERASLKELRGFYEDMLAQEEAKEEENSDLLGGTVVSFFDRR